MLDLSSEQQEYLLDLLLARLADLENDSEGREYELDLCEQLVADLA